MSRTTLTSLAHGTPAGVAAAHGDGLPLSGLVLDLLLLRRRSGTAG